MPQNLKSVHIFNPGDRVAYSIIERATSKSGREYNKHIQGRGWVIEHLEAGTYMIRTEKRGIVRICLPKELRRI